MSKIFCLIVIVICVCFSAIVAQKCGSSGLRKFDANIAKLITIGNSGRKFPENKGDELKTFCDKSMQYITDIDNYKSKCMKDGRVASVMVYALKNTIKQLCKKDSPRLNEIIAATPCANTGNAEIRKCYSTLIDSILGIQNEEDHKQKVPMLCCEYHKLFPCMADRLKRIDKCTESHLNTIFDFVRSINGNVIDMFCGDYTESSDKCDSIGAPPKKKKSQRRTKSFAIPLMDLLQSFPDPA